jgi:hypothetical protein
VLTFPPVVSRGPLPNPACSSLSTGLSTCLTRWSASGGCWCGGPRGRDVAAAVAVAGHGDAGCAGRIRQPRQEDAGLAAVTAHRLPRHPRSPASHERNPASSTAADDSSTLMIFSRLEWLFFNHQDAQPPPITRPRLCRPSTLDHRRRPAPTHRGRHNSTLYISGFMPTSA